MYLGVDGVVVLFKVLHHVRRRLAFRDQLSETQLTNRRSVLGHGPVRPPPVSEMLPQCEVVLTAGRVEVGRQEKVFKRLARDCALRSHISSLYLDFMD